MSHSVEMLIAFRFLQAIGVCVGMVAPGAIVRDMFPVNESAKVFSLLILVLGVSPIIAPTFVSYLIAAFGWHSVFIILSVIVALLFIAVVFLLPESKEPDPDFSLRPKTILTNYLTVLKEPQFYTFAFAGAIAAAGLFAYLAGSPFVFMNLFKVSPKEYGWIFAIIAAGLITSSQLNTIFLRKFNSSQIIKVTLLVQASIGLFLFTGSALGWLNIYATIGLIFLFLSCQGFSFPNSAALSLAPFKKEAGSASALMGALQMGLGAFASAMVGFINNGTSLPMTGIMAACAALGLLVLTIGQQKIKKASTTLEVQ